MTEKYFIGTSNLAQQEPPTNNSPFPERQKYEPYQWYVGHALFSFESIVAVSDDKEWKNTFAGLFVTTKNISEAGSFRVTGTPASPRTTEGHFGQMPVITQPHKNRTLPFR